MLLQDFRRLRGRLKYTFHRINKEPQPSNVKSDWDPPVQPSVALDLETCLEEVKFELANIILNRPKDNLADRESKMLSKNYRVTRTLN